MTNQELNEQVARKLDKKTIRHQDGTLCLKDPRGCYALCPDYCTDIAAAWEIVEKIKKPERAIGVCAPMGHGTWTCEIYERGKRIVGEMADTAAMAICLAFLKLNLEDK